MTDPAAAALVDSLAATNREVDRLRERSHRHGNQLQEQQAEIDALNRRVDDANQITNEKLDAIHHSLKEDLVEIKHETKSTNGKVAAHAETIAKLKGAVALLAIGAPSMIALAVVAIEHLH
jgi:predicted  nucleic acid-binding Zn-ribbon protein